MIEIFTAPMMGLEPELLNMITLGVLAILVLLVLYFVFRWIRRPRLAGGRRSKQARLAITDAALVDERRKLVLVRRDDVEHLVLIGGATDIVIESDIRRSSAARPQPQAAPIAVAPAAPAPAPVPAPAPLPASRPVQPVATSEPAVAPQARTVAPQVTPTAAAPAAPAATPKAEVVASQSAPIVAAGAVTATTIGAAVHGAGDLVSAAATTGSEVVQEVQSALAQSDANVAAPNVASNAPEVAAPTKSTVSDDMDALLNEITTNR